MKFIMNQKLIFLLLICSFLNISCYTYKKNTYNENYKPYYWPASFHEGQKVLITTHDDQKHFIRITSINKEYLEDKDKRIYYKDIKTVKTLKFNPAVTLLFTPLFVASIVIIGVILFPPDWGDWNYGG